MVGRSGELRQDVPVILENRRVVWRARLRQIDPDRQIKKFLARERADILTLLNKGSLFTRDELGPLAQAYDQPHDVAERLLDFDERVHLFRFHHLKLAQRIIGGGVVGTMGTPVEVLHQRMEHLFYKELWDVRNRITAESMKEM